MTPAAPPALRALLAGSVDYAGLFPPAGLPLEPALENQAAYVRGGDAWMLGRFVLPTAKLSEAGPLVAGRFDAGHPLRISAPVPKADSADGLLENLRLGLDEIATFQQAHGDLSVIDQLELPLPPDSAAAPALRALLRQAAGLIETLSPGPMTAFWEVPFSDRLPATVRTVAEHNAENAPAPGNRPFAVKLRTGGTAAAAFPTTGQLAAALIAARDAGVGTKFTAGLHHPLRHFNDSVGTRMHGFLNVFAAGVLAREHGLDAAETGAILAEESPTGFRFEADGLAWHDYRVTTSALAAHREFVISFGSCSFDEPRDDLRRLGLLT